LGLGWGWGLDSNSFYSKLTRKFEIQFYELGFQILKIR
jgi:hypothetical protein